jgi:hypothetical protein
MTAQWLKLLISEIDLAGAYEKECALAFPREKTVSSFRNEMLDEHSGTNARSADHRQTFLTLWATSNPRIRSCLLTGAT